MDKPFYQEQLLKVFGEARAVVLRESVEYGSVGYASVEYGKSINK